MSDEENAGGEDIAAPAGAMPFTIQEPKLVAIVYTAVYDTGQIVQGGVVHDGTEEPLSVQFQNARGSQR